MHEDILRHQPRDTVGVAIRPLQAGSQASVRDISTQEVLTVPVKQDIPAFHKIALISMEAGSDVIEYGQIIGLATAPIGRGMWTHIHNIKTKRW